MKEWDPIRVTVAAAETDEYDGYLGPIVNRLREDANAGQIAECLSGGVERDHTGVAGPGEQPTSVR
jgi:hypothetical protein